MPTPRLQIIAGEVNGRLTAIKFHSSTKQGRRWEFQCTCGQVIVALVYNVLSENTTSCGCYRRELPTMSRVKHGGNRTTSKHELYSTWTSMRARCNNPNQPNYPNYGGRGIKICSRWDDFALFILDMGPKPTPEHSIDRVDNDGDYEPNNCQWATRSEQNSNQR